MINIKTLLVATILLISYQFYSVKAAEENKRLQTFPEDFNFLNTDQCYVMGMSVPPFMTQRVALEIYNHWFKTENI